MIRYWNFTDIGQHTGVPSAALRQRAWRGNMPEPDAMVGSMPGWLPATIEEWWRVKGREGEQAESYLTTAEAADRLGISTRTLQSWRGRTGRRGPEPVKLGNLVRYREADVDAWIKRGESE